MRRNLLVLATAAALALPAAAFADDTPTTPDPAKNAAKKCKTLRTEMGATTFNTTYGTNKSKSNAFGKCVSAQTKTEKSNVSSASSSCKAERDTNAEAFKQKYGTNKKKTNAFGKCVSGKSKEASDDQVKATVNAAKTCKAERAQDREAFKQKYGTNKNKSNAFGKCVSKTAKQQYTVPS